MFTHLHRGGWFVGVVLSLAVGMAFTLGSPAFAKGGGGGHGGGGHGGHGGHGHHSSGHHHGGYYHHSGYHHYYGGNGYYNNGYYSYRPNTYYSYPTTTYYPVYSYPAYSYVYPNSTGAVNVVSSQSRFLGIDEQAVADSGGSGMQVLRVHAGSPAEKAGLKAGDVIHSINGYLMQQHGNIAWIIANTPANGMLQMSVRSSGSIADRSVNATIP